FKIIVTINAMQLNYKTLRLYLRTPFKIAHGSSNFRDNVIVQISDNSITGFGEAAPVKQHHENIETVIGYLDSVVLANDLDRLEFILNTLPKGSNSAKAAIDIALHDLLAKKLNIPLYKLLGLDAQAKAVTSFTLGISSLENLQAAAKRLANEFPVIKLKLGAGEKEDLAALRAVKEVTNVKIVGDANCAWSLDQAKRIIPKLADLGLEMIEQPLAEQDYEGMKKLKDLAIMPVFADEPVRDSKDIVALANKVDGINIKLMKSAGIRQALKMIATARAHDLEIMLGCMVESSIAITAAAHIASLVDHLDLDGNLLIKNDPYLGATVENGYLKVPEGNGLGIKRISGK
ncbi:MAG TPA: dipeptide epimerase, partial [Trueperaceae bacterium]|nr:dipeptide epimerase [Trueperaceae bacterium]